MINQSLELYREYYKLRYILYITYTILCILMFLILLIYYLYETICKKSIRILKFNKLQLHILLTNKYYYNTFLV